MSALGEALSIPGVYRRPAARAEGFPRVRTDVVGFVGIAGPRHIDRAVAVEDWKSYVAEFRRDADGRPLDTPAGSVLEAAVRQYFANGGRRLVIVNVAERVDPERRDAQLNRLLGMAGDDRHPVGLELLLRQDEVAIVAIPDFDAIWMESEDRYDPADLPDDPCFGRCLARRAPAAPSAQTNTAVMLREARLFGDETLLWAQRYFIERLMRQRWRWFGIVAPPPGLDADGAILWRNRLTAAADDWSAAALYWPWTLAQDSPGAPVRPLSPVGSVAGIFAQTDLARGPHAAPANRRIEGIVGLDSTVGDAENAAVYDAGINVLRALPGRGIQLWGARTLLWQNRQSRGDPLAFVNARRCLSAIARSCEVIGQPIVFNPNDTLQRIKLHQLLTDYLLRIHRQGALLGDSPQDAFFVQIDPPSESPEGQLVCKVGVALAAPAEFIVFRIGRKDGVIEGEVQP